MSTKHIKKPLNVCLFVAITYSAPNDLKKILSELKKIYGPIESASDEYDFSKITSYYASEMGENLKKRIFAFKKMIPPTQIVKIKHNCNSLEERHSINGKRKVNIDPGYVSITNVILVSTKNFTHRIYISKGIYGEMTLIFKKGGKIQTFEWSYPDIKREIVQKFLLKQRERLLEK